MKSVTPERSLMDNSLTPENIIDQLKQSTAQSLLLPIKKIADITYTPPIYLVDQLLVGDTVGFISASPGSTKTWLAWDIALSVASGTKALGVFESTQGKVLVFNAEDSPGAITKPRLSALASARNLNINTVDDLSIIDTSILMIDDPKTQAMIAHTLQHHKPSLMILDPLRQVHSQNEDKASDMAPILGFLRQMQREHKVTILLVCHERKHSTNGEQGRRADRTRGSNALEGWRDTAIYMDKPDSDKKTKVQIYHRGYVAPEPFFFELKVDNTTDEEGNRVMQSAKLEHLTGADVEGEKLLKVCRQVFEFIKIEGEVSANKVAKGLGGSRNRIYLGISAMVERDIIVSKGLKIDRKLSVSSSLNGNFPEFFKIHSGTTPF